MTGRRMKGDKRCWGGGGRREVKRERGWRVSRRR